MLRRDRISSSAHSSSARSPSLQSSAEDSHLNRAVQAIFSFAILAFAALCGTSCAVPIAPGYQIKSQSLAVRFIPAKQNGDSSNGPSLQVRSEYSLLNSGNSDLKFVDATLPDRQIFGAHDIRMEVDGHEVA